MLLRAVIIYILILKKGRTHIVDLLLKNGANPAIQNKDMEIA